MARIDEIRTAVGIIGNVISFFLFLSPIVTFVKIYKAKSVQAFKPDPYVATILNCVMWVFYGLPIVKPDTILVSSINGIGFVIQVIYVTIFIIYSDWSKRRKIFIFLVCEVIFVAIIIGVTLGKLHDHKRRSTLVGTICIILNIAMYFSPLTIMNRVIKTKSVKYMPFLLSLANFANGAIWTAYALLKFDINVVVPNGLGTLSGAIQLILYAYFYPKTNWKEEEGKPPQDVELAVQNDEP